MDPMLNKVSKKGWKYEVSSLEAIKSLCLKENCIICSTKFTLAAAAKTEARCTFHGPYSRQIRLGRRALKLQDNTDADANVLKYADPLQVFGTFRLSNWSWDTFLKNTQVLVSSFLINLLIVFLSFSTFLFSQSGLFKHISRFSGFSTDHAYSLYRFTKNWSCFQFSTDIFRPNNNRRVFLNHVSLLKQPSDNRTSMNSTVFCLAEYARWFPHIHDQGSQWRFKNNNSSSDSCSKVTFILRFPEEGLKAFEMKYPSRMTWHHCNNCWFSGK